MKLNKKNLKKFLRNLVKSHNALVTFVNRLKKIWLCLLILLILHACSVTRTITTESSSIQKGDTSVIIQTKTIESYTANKHKQ